MDKILIITSIKGLLTNLRNMASPGDLSDLKIGGVITAR